MDRREFEIQAQLAGSHWWFSGRRCLVRRLLKSPSGEDRAALVLDVGCGTGTMFGALSALGRPVGLDLSPDALALCRREAPRPLVQATALVLPFADETFSLVTIFDVLYHQWVQDDGAVLRECCRVCQPGGTLLVAEPALEWLRSSHDVVYHTRRRYTPGELRGRVAAAAFRVVKSGYANSLLFPGVFLVRLLRRLWPPAPLSSDLRPVPARLNRLLTAISCLEAAAWPHASFPLGSSALCLARRPLG